MNWNPNENDPWGKRNNNPPDLDEAINQFRKMFSGGGGGKGAPFKFNFKFFSYLILGLLALYILSLIHI